MTTALPPLVITFLIGLTTFPAGARELLRFEVPELLVPGLFLMTGPLLTLAGEATVTSCSVINSLTFNPRAAETRFKDSAILDFRFMFRDFLGVGVAVATFLAGLSTVLVDCPSLLSLDLSPAETLIADSKAFTRESTGDSEDKTPPRLGEGGPPGSEDCEMAAASSRTLGLALVRVDSEMEDGRAAFVLRDRVGFGDSLTFSTFLEVVTSSDFF